MSKADYPSDSYRNQVPFTMLYPTNMLISLPRQESHLHAGDDTNAYDSLIRLVEEALEIVSDDYDGLLNKPPLPFPTESCHVTGTGTLEGSRRGEDDSFRDNYSFGDGNVSLRSDNYSCSPVEENSGTREQGERQARNHK